MRQKCTQCGSRKQQSGFGMKAGKPNTKCKKCVAANMVEYNHRTGRTKTRKGEPRVNLIGKRFGNLVVLENLGTRGNKRFWLCKCNCGNSKEVFHSHLMSGKTVSCGCAQHRSGSSNPLWGGHGEISGNRWCEIKRHRKKGHTFDITIQYAWELFVKQRKKCVLSGVDLSIECASLDRIDSSQGYIKGNVQWLHKDVNWMKNSFDQEYFIEMCRKVADVNYA